jgi:hypothetical protein
MRRITLLAGTALILAAWSGGAAAVQAGPTLKHRHPSGAVEWAGFAGNAQHAAVARSRPQAFRRIRWTAKVDLSPPLLFDTLPIHYGSPMITAANTVLVPTRKSTKAGFRVDAYSGRSGARRWSLGTDWRPMPFASNGRYVWVPPLPAVLTPHASLAVAGAGGTVLLRKHANNPKGAVRRLVFYGASQWRDHRSLYTKAVRITTPLTAGRDGSIYFGFSVTGSTPAKLSGGIARIDRHGHGSWISAAAAAGGNPAITDVVMNCAPALSPSGKIVYIAVTTPINSFTTPARGYLTGLNAATLKPRFHVFLRDPLSGRASDVSSGFSSASPTVGPDGDVYYGVTENPQFSHNLRGWLLHFNATLATEKTPGSFGWDNTVSVVPARAVPRYHGASPYLLVSKYNNYPYGPPGHRGDGLDRVAVLDPRVSQQDPYANTRSMKTVQTVLSPVHVPGDPAGERYEWCINSAVVDVADDSVIANSEDGILYRWDLRTNTLAEKIRLNAPIPEAYTPTVIGPDGTVYAINNSTLYAIGR